MAANPGACPCAASFNRPDVFCFILVIADALHGDGDVVPLHENELCLDRLTPCVRPFMLPGLGGIPAEAKKSQ